MILVICGSRFIDDYKILEEAMERSMFHPSQIISGGFEGVDELGEEYAERNYIPLHVYEPSDPFEDQAEEMARMCDGVIAIPGENSIGTWEVVHAAGRHGKEVYIHRF